MPTTTIQPDETASKDSYYGTSSGTIVDASTLLLAGDQNSSNAFRSLIEFSIASIPAGSVITTATLELYNAASGGANNTSLTFDVHRVTASWAEASGSAPTFDAGVQASLANVTKTAGWNVWTITTMVQNWWTGTWANYGLLLKQAGEDGAGDEWKEWRASGYATASERPKLVVIYNAPPNTPTATSPTGTSGSPGSVTNEITPRLSWSYSDPDSDPQSAFQVRIYDTSNNLIHDSGEQASANAYYDVPLAAGLKYGTTYGWQVRVKEAVTNYWTAYTTLTYFKCTIPALSTPTVAANAAAARIDLSWTAATAENLAGYNVYRRKDGDTTWTKINLLLLTSASYNDDTAVNGQAYDYCVTAVASDGYENGKSTPATQAVAFLGVWLGSVKVDLRTPPRIRRPMRASRRMALDGTWQVQDYGYGPRELELGVCYRSRAEADAIRGLFSIAGVAVSYRDDRNNAIRGKLTSNADDEDLFTEAGYLNLVLTEVSA